MVPWHNLTPSAVETIVSSHDSHALWLPGDHVKKAPHRPQVGPGLPSYRPGSAGSNSCKHHRALRTPMTWDRSMSFKSARRALPPGVMMALGRVHHGGG